MGLFSLLPILGILFAGLRHGKALAFDAHAIGVHAANVIDPGQTLLAAALLVLSIRLTRSARRRR